MSKLKQLHVEGTSWELCGVYSIYKKTCFTGTQFDLFTELQYLVDGADEYLQLLDVASNTMRALCNMPQEFSYNC